MSIFRPFRFMSKIEIEASALDILLKMQANLKYGRQLPLDASRVAEFLDLDLVWDSIPQDEGGEIAARILPLEKLIEINEDIPQLRSGFGESTIAHEIGHWVLHIDSQEVERYQRLQKKGVKIEVKPLLCRSEDLSIAGMEWQAQYFAGCLLMPQHILTQMIRGKDLTKWQILYRIAEELGVTISNLVTRLQDLGWIDFDRDSRRIYLVNNQPLISVN